MSIFTDAVASIIDNCVHYPSHSTHLEGTGNVQMRVRDGVNKWFWKSWESCKIVIDDPGFPPQCHIYIYERNGLPSGRETIVEAHAYLAVCAQPGTYLGTSSWLWVTANSWGGYSTPPLPFRQVHIGPRGTSSGALGLVVYPHLPT